MPKKKNVYVNVMKFQDLEPGTYEIKISNFDLKRFCHGTPKPIMLIELRGGQIIVEFSDESKAILQVAMDDHLENLKDGDAFTVHKDGHVTAWEDIVGSVLYGSGSHKT